MKKSFTSRALASVALASTLLLAACGGGGGGDTGGAEVPAAAFPGSSAHLAGICSLEGQKRFVRAYLDEVYLWYDEIVDVDPARYSTVPDYFNALLVTNRDRFSAVLPISQAEQVRKDVLASKSHTSYVPKAQVLTDADNRRIAYIQFNDHEIGAQDDLITAFQQVKAQGAEQLVLDLRFNSGGYLYIAQTAASMVVGPSAEGKVFERLRYNDKRDADTIASTLTFSGAVQFPESQYARGTALPQLGLNKVYVLTSATTCSSSESIINSLRGIDVEVVVIGPESTCGKPYGFHRKDNCGYAFFAIEFQGTNAKGFGDYQTGFAPTCRVADNSSMAVAGTTTDPLLNAALYHIDNGTCPPGAASAQASGAPAVTTRPMRPAWMGRLVP